MYSSFGEYLIAQKIKDDTSTESGIILTSNQLPKYKVVNPPFDYKDLQDKVVILAAEDRAASLPDGKHVSINYKNILAVEM